jgi:hypothetical protein
MKTELGIVLANRRAPKVRPAEVQRLVALLVKEGTSLTAAQICPLFFGKVPTESRKRRVRAIARAARPRIVSFPNSDGYDLWERCNTEALWDCIYKLEDQGKDLIKQATVMRRALHGGYRGAASDARKAAEEMTLSLSADARDFSVPAVTQPQTATVQPILPDEGA